MLRVESLCRFITTSGDKTTTLGQITEYQPKVGVSVFEFPAVCIGKSRPPADRTPYHQNQLDLARIA